MSTEKKEGKLEIIATKTVKSYDELYVIIDFFNKTLKSHNLMCGLTKNTKDDTMTITIYEI